MTYRLHWLFYIPELIKNPTRQAQWPVHKKNNVVTPKYWGRLLMNCTSKWITLRFFVLPINVWSLSTTRASILHHMQLWLLSLPVITCHQGACSISRLLDWPCLYLGHALPLTLPSVKTRCQLFMFALHHQWKILITRYRKLHGGYIMVMVGGILWSRFIDAIPLLVPKIITGLKTP